MIKHWIDGKEVESKETFTNYNPATNQAIGEVASGGQEEIDLAVAVAKRAAPGWAKPTATASSSAGSHATWPTTMIPGSVSSSATSPPRTTG